MKTGHKIALGLSAAAFILFVANQAAELSGNHFEFTGWLGASVLTGFLAVGMVTQLVKFMEGHRSRLDLIITIIQLVAHVAAELAIWYQTKILNIALPPELPLYIVGLYWVSGVADIFFRFIGRELQLFNGMYKSPETLLQEKLETTAKELTETEQKKAVIEESLKNAQTTLDQERKEFEQRLNTAQALFEERSSNAQALFEQRLTVVEQLLEQAHKTIEQRDRQIDRFNEQQKKKEEESSIKYELSCDVPGCGWTTGLKDTAKSAENSLIGHKNRNHKGYKTIRGEQNLPAEMPVFDSVPLSSDSFR
jgi:hypothetical protein